MPDNVRKVWSDHELDEAMAAVYADVTVNRSAQAKARAALMLAAGETTETRTAMPEPAVRTRRAAPLAAAAAAVALVTVAAVLITQNSAPDEIGPAQSTIAPVRPPATSGSQHAPMPEMPSQPQNSLHTLATRVSETPLFAGQFRYVYSHELRRFEMQASSGTSYVYVAEVRSEQWIPADQRQEWMTRNETTSNRQWIKGTEQEARAADVPIDTPLRQPAGEHRSPCGYPEAQPCQRQPSGPAQDAAKLYGWLANESATHADPPLQFFRIASNYLNAYYPAAVRQDVLEALSHHPYLTVVTTTTRDNRPAISVGIEYADGQLLEELLLDPANGQLIGKRESYLKDADGAKAGDKASDEVINQAIVTNLGALPPR